MDVAAPKRTQKVPTIRFEGFSDAWKLYSLGEVGETRGGLTYTPEDVVEQGGTLVLRSSNIQDGQIAFDDCVYVSCEVPPKSIVRDGDILLCVRNGSRQLIGKSLLITKEHKGHAFGAFMSVYRSECSGFVAELMNTHEFYRQVHEHLGATINQITNASLNSFKFRFPTLPEQQKIAAFLGAVDRKIQQLKRKQALLEQYKKGVVQQLFAQELRFKRKDGGEFPEWEERRLGEICSTFKSGEGITSDSILEEGEYPVYGGNGLRGYANSFTHDGFYVLIGRQGALCGNINRVRGKSYISEHAIAVQCDKSSDTEWLAQLLTFMNLNRLSESSAQPGLAVNKLVQLKVMVPSLDEQTRIAGFLMALDAKVAGVAQAVEAAQRWKKGLLQGMFV